MVKGLDVFRERFAGLEDQYVLIGGTAATLAMAEAGLEFRATESQARGVREPHSGLQTRL
jgi:hypothetical protein